MSTAQLLLAQAQAQERVQAQMMNMGHRQDDPDTESMDQPMDFESGPRRKRKKSFTPGQDIVKDDMDEVDGMGCRNQTGFIGVRQRKWGMYAAGAGPWWLQH